MEQLTFDSLTKEKFKIDKKIRLIELFAGIGSQAKALKNIGADFEHHFVCEFDEFAIKSYNEIHNTSFDVSDVTKVKAKDLNIVDKDVYTYILTYSFPCPCLLKINLGKGMSKGGSTRSGLLWEVERILNELEELPQILLMENVTQVHSNKNIKDFEDWVNFLSSKGYSNYLTDLNAKGFNIPQSRNRSFMISILGDYYYEFPQPAPLKLRLKDMLEDEVNERFYLSDKAIQGIKNSTYERKQHIVQEKDWCDTILARDYKDPKCVKVEEDVNPVRIGGLYDDGENQHQAGSVYDKDAICPTITTCEGGNRQPLVIDEIKVVGNYMPSNHDASRVVDIDDIAPTVKENHGTVTAIAEPSVWLSQKGKEYVLDSKRGMCTDVNADVSQTITAKGQQNWTGSFISPDIKTVEKSTTIGSKDDTRIVLKNGDLISNKDKEQIEKLRIRKLTPKECWRLMGFSDEDFNKASKVNSASQLYKQAGNSIVVPVLEAIFKNLF